ncbi:MAG TPA: hypothetical protein G4O04_04125 [Anaerolineae bacterium]|nr:hypothetical protein [Anaerolineae bacterium]HID85166.1 hypothetical protein [Anaerolineales bacterium]HIQ08087.1 hypothetical protein [Anaerolineaceae bacterium]
MTLPKSATDPLWRIYITLARYPILRTRIRARMRQELFRRGVITPKEFEARVREEAIRSQYAEGLQDPYSEEPAEIWETRLDRVRSHLTDFYFAYNLPFDLFEEIVRGVLAERAPRPEEIEVGFNPELAPLPMLFEQAYHILKMSPEQRAKQQARLQEIKVVLIRTLVSDQLDYVSLAKDWLTVQDLDQIRKRKIGPGKIGGKAAGMLLAYRILQSEAPEEVRSLIRIPESYYLGADVMYTFMVHNDLMKWADQKYKDEAQIRAEFPMLRQEYLRGTFPQDILERFRALLVELSNRPIIVRSSSLLEDNFGTSFAGKYESHFLPNQGSLEENLTAFTRAIASIYASALGPDPLLYRRAKGLLDYDERIAILIQVVEGEPHEEQGLFYPQAAGVAFSYNLLVWASKIRPEDGFLRLVYGLGTRAVDRVGNDYPRLVALSHPTLRPEVTPKAIQHYSQHYVDVIDLKRNAFRTVPLAEAVDRRDPGLRYVFSMNADGYLTELHTGFIPKSQTDQLVVTFDQWLRRTTFAAHMRLILKRLERAYRTPVDMEFAARVVDPGSRQPRVEITILQCRPQSTFKGSAIEVPPDIAPEDIVLETYNIVPHGQVEGIRYVLFVIPEGYYTLTAQRYQLVLAIGKVNLALEGTPFICVGPGRWGSSNPELGVQVGYADIYNTRALVELAGASIGPAPEPSFGTHFFQDLMEANIYPLAVDLGDERTVFNRAFFYETPNRLADFLGETPPDWLERTLRVIAVEDFRPQATLSLVMEGRKKHAVAFVLPDASAEGD